MKSDTQQMPEPLVALVLLALELRCPIETLLRRFAGSIVIDPSTGLRAITAERSRMYLAAVNAEAREKAAQRAEVTMPEARLRVQAIKARQEQLGEATDGAALGRMMATDLDAQLDRAARDRAEMLNGATTYHRIKED
jgi:hypothetical protein